MVTKGKYSYVVYPDALFAPTPDDDPGLGVRESLVKAQRVENGCLFWACEKDSAVRVVTQAAAGRPGKCVANFGMNPPPEQEPATYCETHPGEQFLFDADANGECTTAALLSTGRTFTVDRVKAWDQADLFTTVCNVK